MEAKEVVVVMVAEEEGSLDGLDDGVHGQTWNTRDAAKAGAHRGQHGSPVVVKNHGTKAGFRQEC